MGTLADKIADPAQRGPIIAACADLVDREVAAKTGLGGLVVRSAYTCLKAIKPGMTRHVVNALLDEFVAAIEPTVAAYLAQPHGSLADHLKRHQDAVAQALLQVTDARVGKLDNRALQGFYGKLRPSAARHVTAALPNLATLLQGYL